MENDLAARLRELRQRRGWTVAEMAERTGLPKRTLDKYMLRTDAILPGFDALLALAKGLGVSLDWLAFGNEFASDSSGLLAAVAAERAGLRYFEAIYRYAKAGDRLLVEGECLLGLTPEEWATDLGHNVGDMAKNIARSGATREELLVSISASVDRLKELAHDRAARVVAAAEKPDNRA